MRRVHDRSAKICCFWRVALAALTVVVNAMPAAAQQAISTATITGIVHDNQGLPVPGVTVEAVNEQTRQTRATVSNSDGIFNIPALVASRYTLRVSLSGFKTVEQVGIQLRSNEVFNAGTIAMTVAQVAETVTVTAAAAGVETATAVRTQVIDQGTIESLVSRGRDPVRLLNALPGVDPNLTGSITGGTIGTNLPTMQGTAGFSTYVAIDGVGPQMATPGTTTGSRASMRFRKSASSPTAIPLNMAATAARRSTS